MLLPRVLTALVGIPLILAAIEVGGLPFIFFVLCIGLLCLYEAFALLSQAGHVPRTALGYSLGFALFVLFILPSYAEPRYAGLLKGPSVLGLGLTVAIVILTLVELFHIKSRSLISSAVTLFAILFVFWPLAHLILLRELAPLGKIWCLFLFITIWISDTFGYFTGKKLGKRKLAPLVSPRKTIEGLAGELFGAALVSSVFWALFFRDGGFHWLEIVLLGVVLLGLGGQLSDLVESVLKREARVKDSSNTLWGHGGFLDRFDSFLLTTPMLYYYLIFR